jgi:hypothetical protein
MSGYTYPLTQHQSEEKWISQKTPKHAEQNYYMLINGEAEKL